MFEPDPEGHPRGDGLLPAPVDGTLPASLIVESSDREGDRTSGLPTDVAYSAYEAGDRRFAWLHAVPQVEGEGAQFFALTLVRDVPNGVDWRIDDIDRYDSPEDAKMASGRAWVKATGGPDLPTEPVADW